MNKRVGLAAEVVDYREHNVPSWLVGQRPGSDMWSPCVIDGERQDVDQSGSCCGRNRLDSQTLVHLADVRKENAGVRDCRLVVCSRVKESSIHSRVRVVRVRMTCWSRHFRCRRKSCYRHQLEAKRRPTSPLSLQSGEMDTGNRRTTILRPGLESGPAISTVAPALRFVGVWTRVQECRTVRNSATLNRTTGELSSQ